LAARGVSPAEAAAAAAAAAHAPLLKPAGGGGRAVPGLHEHDGRSDLIIGRRPIDPAPARGTRRARGGRGPSNSLGAAGPDVLLRWSPAAYGRQGWAAVGSGAVRRPALPRPHKSRPGPATGAHMATAGGNGTLARRPALSRGMCAVADATARVPPGRRDCLLPDEQDCKMLCRLHENTRRFVTAKQSTCGR